MRTGCQRCRLRLSHCVATHIRFQVTGRALFPSAPADRKHPKASSPINRKTANQAVFDVQLGHKLYLHNVDFLAPRQLFHPPDLVIQHALHLVLGALFFVLAEFLVLGQLL